MMGGTHVLLLQTGTGVEIIDVTPRVQEAVRKSGITEGVATVFTRHTTTAIRINENEPLLLEDLKALLEAIAPRLGIYHHDDGDSRTECARDEPCNAHSHLKSLLLGTSESVPIADGKLQLGRWQSVLFLEFDGPRKREIAVQVTGT